MTSAKNKHGVYEDYDDLRLMDERAGIPLVEVRVADTDGGWRARCCFSFTSGNWWGSSGPITDFEPPFVRKDDAVAYAANIASREIGKRQASRGGVGYGAAAAQDARLACRFDQCCRRPRTQADGVIRMTLSDITCLQLRSEG